MWSRSWLHVRRRGGLCHRRVLPAACTTWKQVWRPASLPFFLYLLIFKFYIPLRRVTRLDLSNPPSYYVLPNIEYHLFFFQPHKVLSKLANPVFDVLAAIPYLIHFPLPVLFGAYLVIHPSKRGALFLYMWCGWMSEPSLCGDTVCLPDGLAVVC